MTLGSYPSTGLAKARELHTEARGLLRDQDIDPADYQRATKAKRRMALAEEVGEPTVQELINEYLNKHARVKKKETSWKEDERLLSKDVTKRWGTQKVISIHRRDVVKMVESVAARGGSDHSQSIARSGSPDVPFRRASWLDRAQSRGRC